MADLIDELIEGVTVDAYGADEQLWSFRQAFEDHARFPFIGRVVGVEVDITEVDFDGDERHGLVAVCRRAGERHTVSLLDVTPQVTEQVRDLATSAEFSVTETPDESGKIRARLLVRVTKIKNRE